MANRGRRKISLSSSRNHLSSATLGLTAVMRSWAASDVNGSTMTGLGERGAGCDDCGRVPTITADLGHSAWRLAMRLLRSVTWMPASSRPSMIRCTPLREGSPRAWACSPAAAKSELAAISLASRKTGIGAPGSTSALSIARRCKRSSSVVFPTPICPTTIVHGPETAILGSAARAPVASRSDSSPSRPSASSLSAVRQCPASRRRCNLARRVFAPRVSGRCVPRCDCSDA